MHTVRNGVKNKRGGFSFETSFLYKLFLRIRSPIAFVCSKKSLFKQAINPLIISRFALIPLFPKNAFTCFKTAKSTDVPEQYPNERK